MGFRSVATAAQVGGVGPVTITVPVPAGVVDGDVMVAGIYNLTPAGVVTPATPAGWTLIGTTNGNASAGILALYYRTASSEPADYTWSVGTGADTVALLLGYICSYQDVSVLVNTSDEVHHNGVISPDTLTLASAFNPGTTDVILHSGAVCRGGSVVPVFTVDAATTERDRVDGDGGKIILVASDEEWVSSADYPSRDFAATVTSGLIWDGAIRTNAATVTAVATGGDAWAWVG